jgi:ribosomal-protein-alanine acetyltransferase
MSEFLARHPENCAQVQIRRLAYPDLPQVVAIERRVFPTPWSLAMFVLELSKQTGICLAATAQEQTAPVDSRVDCSGPPRCDGSRPGSPDWVPMPDGHTAGGHGTQPEETRRGLVVPSAGPGPGTPAGEQRLVGYLICSRYDTVWHVMNLAVDVDRQRMGLASALLAELYARVEDDTARFTLEVRRSNHIAIHLYEREGFRAAGVRRRYYQDNGEDALVMWRTPSTLAERSGGRGPGDWVGRLGDVPNPGPV